MTTWRRSRQSNVATQVELSAHDLADLTEAAICIEVQVERYPEAMARMTNL